MYVNLHPVRREEVGWHGYLAAAIAMYVCMYVCAVYSESVQESYKRGQQNLSEQPHVFAIAQEAYGDLTLNRSQSIVIRFRALMCVLLRCIIRSVLVYVCMYVCMCGFVCTGLGYVVVCVYELNMYVCVYQLIFGLGSRMPCDALISNEVCIYVCTVCVYRQRGIWRGQDGGHQAGVLLLMVLM